MRWRADIDRCDLRRRAPALRLLFTSVATCCRRCV